MKIGFFTDSHYSSQLLTCGKRYNSKSLEKIRQAYSLFEREKCSYVICLGDLIDKENDHEKEVQNLKEVAKIISGSPLQTFCLMGNHDAFTLTREEFYDILGLPEPAIMDIDGKRFIFLDACHFKTGTHYAPGDSDWTDTFYPHVDTLKEQIESAHGEVYIFLHQNIDPNISCDHRLYNSEEINRILRKSGKIKTVYQGHYHKGNRSIHDGIEYITFPAMCENDDAVFIEEI